MSGQFATRSWVIGLLVGSLATTIVVGGLHEAEILSEDINPLLHLLREWAIEAAVLLIVVNVVVRFIPSPKE